VFDYKPYGKSSEVYSWAINMSVLLSHKHPFPGVSQETFRKIVIEGGRRPKLPAWVPLPLKELLVSCWAHDADTRPTMKQVVDEMRTIMDGLE